MKHVLTIAGSDSSGGAGIQADLKTFAALGAYGMSVVTAVTAQNTLGVNRVHDLPPTMIWDQLVAVFSDIRVDAVKIGMLSQPEVISTVATALREYRPPVVVLDPVMVAKSGYQLLQPAAIHRLIDQLLPLATVVTPNLPEAEVLSNQTINSVDQLERASTLILQLGTSAVLCKGGHLSGDPIDILNWAGQITHFPGQRLSNRHTHGTGCSLSSAMAVELAMGHSLVEAARSAKSFVAQGIAAGFTIGRGVGPIHHLAGLYQKAGIGDG